MLDGEGGAAEGQAGRGRAQKGRYLRLVLAGCILPADLVTAIGPLIAEMRCMGCLSLQIHKQASMAYVVCICWLAMHVLAYRLLFMSKKGGMVQPNPSSKDTALVLSNPPNSSPTSTTTSRLPTYPHPFGTSGRLRLTGQTGQTRGRSSTRGPMMRGCWKGVRDANHGHQAGRLWLDSHFPKLGVIFSNRRAR